jgi:hypothetical protein
MAEFDAVSRFPGPQPFDAKARSNRFLVLDRIQIERANREIHCRVQLTQGGKSYHGEAREIDSPNGLMRAAARATLAAAEQIGRNINLALEGVTIVDLFSRKYVAVSVEGAQERQFVMLAGMVMLETNRAIEDAAALATLRAVDRWLESP